MQPLQLVIPPGVGIERVRGRLGKFPDDYFGRLMMWEPPRRDQLYVVPVDVGDGIGKDRSVIDVIRVGTVQQQEEQVAQWISDRVDPLSLAPIVDAIGRLYSGSDGQEALLAIECNNHGLVTQAEVQRHHGYGNLYVWQFLDSADPDKAYSTRIGWYTTVRTRPIMLARLLKKVKAVDAHTGRPDFIVNSPFTIQEMRTFRTEDGIREAEADPSDPNAHDDCIMCAAIGVQVCSTIQYEGEEPLEMARRRLGEERARQAAADQHKAENRDFINTEYSVEEIDRGLGKLDAYVDAVIHGQDSDPLEWSEQWYK